MSELLRRLIELPPRDRQIAERIALQDMTLEAFASLYGVDEAAAARLAWSVFSRLGALAVDDEGQFERFVTGWRTGEGAGVLAQLKVAREEARVRLREVDEVRARSRWRTVEEWLRWIAIVIIVLLSIWFWRRDAERRPPEPRPSVQPR